MDVVSKRLEALEQRLFELEKKVEANHEFLRRIQIGDETSLYFLIEEVRRLRAFFSAGKNEDEH